MAAADDASCRGMHNVETDPPPPETANSTAAAPGPVGPMPKIGETFLPTDAIKSLVHHTSSETMSDRMQPAGFEKLSVCCAVCVHAVRVERIRDLLELWMGHKIFAGLSLDVKSVIAMEIQS